MSVPSISLRFVLQSYGDLILLALLVLAIVAARVIFGWQPGPTVQGLVSDHTYYPLLAIVFGAMVGASDIKRIWNDSPRMDRNARWIAAGRWHWRNIWPLSIESSGVIPICIDEDLES